jgi:hypothetical protein
MMEKPGDPTTVNGKEDDILQVEPEENGDMVDDGVEVPGTGWSIILKKHFLRHSTWQPPGDGKKKKKKKKPKKKKIEQTDPPRIVISHFYPDGIYPEGEIQHYKDECVYPKIK